MKRLLILCAAAAFLSACMSLPDWSQTPADRTQREDARHTAARTCPKGNVEARPGSDGATQGDYVCKRRKD